MPVQVITPVTAHSLQPLPFHKARQSSFGAVFFFLRRSENFIEIDTGDDLQGNTLHRGQLILFLPGKKNVRALFRSASMAAILFS